MVPDTVSEAQAVDSMTHAMLSSSMLLVFSDVVFSERRDDLTVGQFFDSFMNTHNSKRFRPFNEGVILGILYWLMFMKENWSDLVPQVDLGAWGIAPIRLTTPKKPEPSIWYFVRRIRNAMGHSAPEIKVPAGTTTETMVKNVTITFHDENRKDPADTFDAEITLEDALTLTHKLHAIVLNDVAKRHGVTPPTD
jgi:hypothetical protein